MKRATDSLGINIWPDGPALLPFPSAGAAHVWRVWLPPLRSHAARWRTSLTTDENARADRFHFDRDRETWLITRGILRTLLGRYLDLPASTLELTCNASGKPALHPRFLTRDLRFNVSHSNQCSLLAFASGIDIGVDVECNQGHRDLELARALRSCQRTISPPSGASLPISDIRPFSPRGRARKPSSKRWGLVCLSHPNSWRSLSRLKMSPRFDAPPTFSRRSPAGRCIRSMQPNSTPPPWPHALPKFTCIFGIIWSPCRLLRLYPLDLELPSTLHPDPKSSCIIVDNLGI